ncbi:unnamed protein product [Phyllotreta striolata]|uniref:Uncharacterized protein n=1 Tax=Phyllotreta striolata TaxID=444603 RepID=A0A9P0DQ29_PHYSR|nr:unnamed protein product [Phyllotreta striolata]
MCFVLMITLMSYCIKRQSSGSCIMDILSLTFLITLPLIVIIAAFFLLMPFFLDMRPWKKPCNCSKKCNESRVIGLIERIYPDADQFKFKCSGLNFGDNMGIILSECFDNTDYISDKYYISSCSRYWSDQNQMHNIISYQRIKEDRRSIMILEADPPLPSPLAFEYGDLEQEEEENYLYVETNFDKTVDHVLIGWRIRERTSSVPLQEIPIVDYCIPGYPSAVIYSKAKLLAGRAVERGDRRLQSISRSNPEQPSQRRIQE